MNYSIKEKIIVILKNIAVMMLLYSLARLAFYLINHKLFINNTTSDVALAFIYGLRIDLSTVLILSAPYILLLLAPLDFVYKSFYQKIVASVFIICQLPIFILNIADIEYYNFTGARMTTGLGAQKSEIINQFSQFIVNYWHITLLCILSAVVLVRLYKKLPTSNKPIPKGALKYTIISFVLLSIVAIGIRGGMQKKVLQPSYAFTVASGHLAILTLNSSFTLLKSSNKDLILPVSYYPEWSEVYNKITPPQYGTHRHSNKQNVVVILLESFATEFWGIANNGEGYTPFLDSLAKDGLFFRNNFANGRKSIEAVPAIVFGLPSLMDHPLAKSKFQFNTWHGIGEQLSNSGYHTSFFHAAENGSMYFDAVAALAGFNEFYPLERYPKPEDTDGYWGIYDEPFLQYMIKEIDTFKKPFFSMVFTLSSHQPYPIPEQYKNKFKKGPTALHESIGYTDYALEQFFNEAKKHDWYKDTLFIITGDHTQMSPSVDYATMLGRYMVPLLIYHPSQKLSANTNKVVQHSDILPTILDYLNVPQPQTTLFGRSIWQNDDGTAIFQNNGIYHLVKKSYALEYDSNKNTYDYYTYTDPNKITKAENLSKVTKDELKNELTAFIQYFNNGLIQNKLYSWDLDK
ncbi:MAG: sulfatase-like hydrolase/transferase [Bdellovibrionales bacterium]|nr:sulfatase-like hydrolase/transferase [Bdellovibrionales bacterium]